MNNNRIRRLTAGAAIAALYVLLSFLSEACGLCSGVVQCRLSEALCILPVFTSAAIPGLTVGCLLTNLLTGAVPFDVLFGSLATLIGAFGSLAFRKKPLLAPVPPILANAIILPFVFQYVYGFPGAWWYFFLTVFAGEFLSAGLCGLLLYRILKPYRHQLSA